MKKNNSAKREQGSLPSSLHQCEKSGWLRRLCGRGIFRELWRTRYVLLRDTQLEVRDERGLREVFDLVDYERSEEIRKAKSRSKKDHSRFTLIRSPLPGPTVSNLVFLAVSPEEKESWINNLNAAIIRAKNHTLDQVTVEVHSVLVHPTRDRVKILQSRRLPSRAHLLGSPSSHGMLTLDLVAEENYDSGSQEVQGGRQRSGTDVSKLLLSSREPRMETGSLPRGSERSWGRQQQGQVKLLTPQPGKRLCIQGSSRCVSMDEVLSSRPAVIRSELRAALRCRPSGEASSGALVPPAGPLQSLIAQKMQRAQELLEEMRLQELQKAQAEQGERGEGDSPYMKGIDSPRLQHLRGSDSPLASRSPRSSDSPHHRGKDAPCRRGRESPRSKARRNRSRGSSSPRSRGSPSPATQTSSCPDLPDRAHSTPTNTPVSSHLPEQQDSSPDGTADSASPATSPPLSSSSLLSQEESAVARRRGEAAHLLEEAVSSWKEAREVLQEVKALQSQTMSSLPTMTTSSPAGAVAEDRPVSVTSQEGDQSEPS